MSFFRNLFSRRSASDGPSVAAVLPQPAPTPFRSPAPEPVASACPPEDCVSFPLKAITDLFPEELKSALRKQPSEHVHVQVPRSLIWPQLSAGAVRITFAQLRAAAPEVFFHEEAAPASTKVLLPLDIVLREIKPAKRDDQRQPSIPVNIPSIFAKAGQSRQNGSPASGSKEAWYSQRRPTYEAQPAPVPAAAVPTNGKKPVQPEALRIEAKPEPVATVIAPVRAAPNSFAIPLSAVLAVLPPEIRHAVNGSEAQSGSFLIPVGEFEERMRTGKVVFKWGQLRGWCSVPLAAPVAPDIDIDLPLAAVVPIFMAARKTPNARKQVEVDTRIPDVFSKGKIASRVHVADVGPVQPVRPVGQSAPATPEPAPPVNVSPAEIVKRLRSLDGVDGAFIATADGLLVAGDVPHANENVLAAFAPTVFAQLTKYADMARLGLPESIDIHLGDGATAHVRKAGKLYLGLLAQRGRFLPLSELTRISAALQPHAS